jgi:hypothetical protein
VLFYQDFNKKREKLKNEDAVLRTDQAEPAISGHTVLNEKEIFSIRILNDSRASMMSLDSNEFEEVKIGGAKDSFVNDQMKEYQIQKGKVTSTYIMKAGDDDDDSYGLGNVTADGALGNKLNSHTNTIYRIIRHQLNQESHPIRMIIQQFSI